MEKLAKRNALQDTPLQKRRIWGCLVYRKSRSQCEKRPQILLTCSHSTGEKNDRKSLILQIIGTSNLKRYKTGLSTAPLQKKSNKNNTQPWCPLLPSYYYAAAPWYGHGSQGTLCPWSSEDQMVRRFITFIMVGTQVYVVYGASDIILKNTTRLVSSQYDCIVAAIFGFGRYIYNIYVISLGCTLLATMNPPIHPKHTYNMYAYKILSFITHYTNNMLSINYHTTY